jgi:molybdate transport system substrate-binding protein
MRNLWSLITRLAIVIAAFSACSAPASAQLKVIMSAGFSGAYQQVLPEFERTTGITVSTGSGASQGTGSQTIEAQLQRGTPADVVILSREGLADLIAAGRIVAGTDVDLARAGLGAKAGCPVSKLLNAKITLDVALVS